MNTNALSVHGQPFSLKRKFREVFFANDFKKDHFKALDGLRGIAVLLVLFSHASNGEIYFHRFLDFSGAGKMGVYLFFILSAYLLDRQIVRAFQTKRANSAFWKNYFVRRFLRVYPLFFLALVLYYLLDHFGYTTSINTISDIPLHLLLVKGENIFWSIPVEFKYYFISPFIVYLSFKYLKLSTILFSLLFLSLAGLALWGHQIFHFSDVSPLKYLSVFLVGTWLSLYEASSQTSKSKPIEWLGTLSVLLVFAMITPLFQKLTGESVDFQESLLFLPFAFLWGLILYACKYGLGYIRKIFEWDFFRFIGNISFSVYLFHVPVLKAVRNDLFGVPDGLKIYFFLAITVIVSSVTFMLIERPMMKIRWSSAPKIH